LQSARLVAAVAELLSIKIVGKSIATAKGKSRRLLGL
jgi:hypothetical protein